MLGTALPGHSRCGSGWHHLTLRKHSFPAKVTPLQGKGSWCSTAGKGSLGSRNSAGLFVSRRHNLGWEGKGKGKSDICGRSLLLPNSIPAMRAGAAGSALQVSFFLFSLSSSFERVTGKALGIHDLATFSFAYRAEKSSGCPAEHRTFWLTGSGPEISASHLFSLDFSTCSAGTTKAAKAGLG